jgi:heme/copper-type cytochrome/quinol oxidase subunit 4
VVNELAVFGLHFAVIGRKKNIKMSFKTLLAFVQVVRFVQIFLKVTEKDNMKNILKVKFQMLIVKILKPNYG